MICLHCEAALPNDQPQTCGGCQVEHKPRPPIAGINHVSQVLSALDDLRAGDMELDEVEGVLEVFLGLFESFEARWRAGGAAMAARLIPSLQAPFASSLDGIDKALDEGARALDLLQNLETEFSDEQLDEAEAALIAFFQGACSQAASALDEFDSLKAQLQSSGGRFNLKSS